MFDIASYLLQGNEKSIEVLKYVYFQKCQTTHLRINNTMT